jgi:RNA polymerase sigma factor (TIGR02999 family)
MCAMNDVTQILRQIEEGNGAATEQLLPLIYKELRQQAARQLAAEKPGQTLDATALVHEAYLRLVGEQQFENSRHFFAAAAEAMRRILVERARARRSLKLGGGRIRVDLEGAVAVAPERSDELLALDAALGRLAAVEPEAAQLVKLRYFAGCTMNEAANLLGLSLRSANRLWIYAKAWLLRELRSDL